MATLDKAQGLLDELRSASYKAAVKDHEELKQFVKEEVHLSCLSMHAETSFLWSIHFRHKIWPTNIIIDLTLLITQFCLEVEFCEFTCLLSPVIIMTTNAVY